MASGDDVSSVIAYVDGDPFPVLGVTLLSGRPFLPEEHRTALRTVIVNKPFADRYFGGSAVGRTMRLSPARDFLTATEAQIVGVVSGAEGRRNDALPTIFAPAPLTHLPRRTLYVPFRDADALAAAVTAVRHAFREVDARVPVTISTLQNWRTTRSAPRRFTATSTVVLGILALLLAAGGMYAVVSYVVETRHREIGVRMAIGATPSKILVMIVRDALRTAAIGSGIGVALATAAAIVSRAAIYGTSFIDPVAFAIAIGTLLATMIGASLLPGRRAARMHPAVALRAE